MSHSILNSRQRVLLRILVAGGLLMVANAAFLLLFRVTEMTERFALPRDTLPAFYQLMVLGHTIVGLVLAPLAILFAMWHLRAAWKRRHPVSLWTGSSLILIVLALVLSGFFILTEANSRENRPFYILHIAVGVALPLVYVIHRVTSAVAPTWAAIRRALAGAGAVALLMLMAHMVTVPERDSREVADDTATVMATVVPLEVFAEKKDPFLPFAAFADVPAQSPFFPSAATTATGKWMPSRVVTRDELPDPAELSREVTAYGFVQDTLIGAETCQRCHADIVEQWSKSAHRFSSMNNPFYRKPFLDMRARADVGNQRSQWCSGCHEPALMQAGEVLKDFDPDSANAQAGLTCLACHAIDQIHNQTGNGNYNIPDHKDSPYLFDEARDGLARMLGDMIIKAKPTVHKAAMKKPFFETSEYCATCHKVSLDVPVNQYRWIRGQNEYDAWHDSGVSRNAARTFYLPESKKVCQDCHMPLEPALLGDVAAKEGMVRSHRFLAVNTALPHLRGDEETIHRVEQFLQDKKMRVDLFALKRFDAEGNEREVTFALDRAAPELVPGETVEVDVVVRNLGVGHTFPGGTNDSNEGWVHFEVKQPGAGTLFESGMLDENRYLDPRAERYAVLMLDHHGEVAGERNAHDFHVPVYAKVIGPGTADIVRYRFVVPPEAAGSELVLGASLMWRKFNRQYTEYVFAGKDVPDLPVTRIAGNQVTLRVAKDEAARRPPSTAPFPAEDWVRFNDYGIGLFLDGDQRGAARAFGQVAAIVPGRVDGYRNLARSYLQEGDLESAYAQLTRAEEIAPGDPQNAWVWGSVLTEDGRYAEAVEAFRRTLESFPDDRDSWTRLGRALYLDGRFAEALDAFLYVLRIDAEDANAHYHRMLCYRGLGEAEKAAEAETAYLKYKLDDDAQILTRDYRLRDPNAQFLSQPIHIHQLDRDHAKTDRGPIQPTAGSD